MKKIATLIFCLGLSLAAVKSKAQTVAIGDSTDKVYTAVEKEPEFAGGMQKFYKFLQLNVRYPATAFEKKIQGKVLITFVVEKDGALTEIKVVRGIGGGCDEEAVRVMKMSPKWIPGAQNGKPVRVHYTMPISFTLVNSKS